MIKKYLPTKTYDVGENVFIQGTKKNGISNTKLRHVIKGRICKRGKNSMYKVKFQNPMTNLGASKWISVEDIADLQQKHSDKGRLFRKMFLVPLSNEQKLIRQGFDITFNPPLDGNCQFSAIVYHLQSIGIYRSAGTLRHEVVSYLINNLAFGGTNFIPDFLDMGWEDYLREMQSDGTFSDEITLSAMSEIFNVQFEVISTLGPAARQIITPHNSVAMTRLHLGHFAENEGTHYVALNPNQEDCEGKYLHHFLHILLPSLE